MLEIGRHIDSVHSDDVSETILGVINSVKRNKIFLVCGIDNGYITLSVANNFERIESIIFDKWRVIALGMHWIEASTADEDPIVDFGYNSDDDAYGKMTSAITGGEKFCIDDFQKYDPLNLLTSEVIAETSATLVTTWTAGVKFGIWQKNVRSLWAREAAVAAMTTGLVKTFMVIEVDTGGKW